MKLSRIPFILLVLAAPIAAQNDNAPFFVEESGQSFWRLDEAVRSIGGGEGTITIGPGAIRQCAVQTDGVITYRAAKPGTAVFDGVACEGKAALVLRGRGARVDGLIFQNLRVPDRNGAGIRFEKGTLEVENSIFRNSEQGILTHADPAMQLVVDRSTFSGLGGCPDGLCSHSIYAGDIGSITVTRTRFERGTGGHYLKSRAARAEINGNSFDDSRGITTNYMIDLPNGASGQIAGNIFVQGRNKENYSAFIAIGAEGASHSSAGLLIADNEASFATGVDRQSTFVANWTADAVRIGRNQLAAGLKVSDRR